MTTPMSNFARRAQGIRATSGLMTRFSLALPLISVAALAACDQPPLPLLPGELTPVESIPSSDTITSDKLTAPVDVVRDEWGIPHIYGKSFPDVAFAQGYI